MIILILTIVFFSIFAIYFEKKQSCHSYDNAKINKKDNISRSFQKLRHCITFENRSIKWRRSLLTSCMITLLLFIFCWERRPTSSEIIIHIILITLVVTINWNNFSLNSGEKSLHVCNDIIKHIKKLTKN
jgi:hypothetical protein